MKYYFFLNNIVNSHNANLGILSEQEVDMVYQKGSKSLGNFAARLFYAYFKFDEIIKNFKFDSSLNLSQMFDPVRIDYIKIHLIKRNRGFLSKREWLQCQSMMRLRALSIVKQNNK